ncbi:MAG TPA: hypothetical protein VFH70_00155, partial [Acidimicrobiales bacterium]|nr:hypothetical protein [Acidimicrobiales bacterium]
MTQSQMLQPGDLPAEDMIRLHAELEGDPGSAAHREAWDRWQAWLEQLSASGDPAQTGRSARIGRYISTTFPEPTRPATGSLLTGGAGVIGAGAAAYEIGHHVVGHSAAQAAAHTTGMAGAAPGGEAGAAGAA